jgi:hypothetical protein
MEEMANNRTTKQSDVSELIQSENLGDAFSPQ